MSYEAQIYDKEKKQWLPLVQDASADAKGVVKISNTLSGNADEHTAVTKSAVQGISLKGANNEDLGKMDGGTIKLNGKLPESVVPAVGGGYYTAADETARNNLTGLHKGDTVKLDNGLMYIVVSVDANGKGTSFEPYVAESATYASKVPWSGVTGVPADFATKAHEHSADDITSGTLSITHGGTGGTTAAEARANLGISESLSLSGKQPEVVLTRDDYALVFGITGNETDRSRGIWDSKTGSWLIKYETDGSIYLGKPLPVAYGGTGATSAEAARTNLGAAAADHTHSSITNTNQTLSLNDAGIPEYGFGLVGTTKAGNSYCMYFNDENKVDQVPYVSVFARNASESKTLSYSDHNHEITKLSGFEDGVNDQYLTKNGSWINPLELEYDPISPEAGNDEGETALGKLWPDIYIWKSGPIVTITVDARFNALGLESAYDTKYLTGKLPAGWRPRRKVQTPILFDGVDYKAVFVVMTDGQCGIRGIGGSLPDFENHWGICTLTYTVGDSISDHPRNSTTTS